VNCRFAEYNDQEESLMPFSQRVVALGIRHPRAITASMVISALLLIAAVAIPTLLPGSLPLPPVRVDTDPENMLSRTEPVRLYHDSMKKVFDLNEIIVVGVVNDSHPEGVFNPETLRQVYELTEYAKTLRGEVIGLDDPMAGVVPMDIIAPSTVDNIEQGGPGEVKFEWLMKEPPATEEEALAVRDRAAKIPFLQGTLVSESGKALAIYLPITSKDLSYRIYSKLQKKIAEFPGAEQWHITGLPVANDTFGVEMFIQMAISAPLAMLVIFLLMLYFFRKFVLILAPMLLAVYVVVVNMGLLIVTGNTIHIMSSMIPIFIMPISILDSIHILSFFFDRYQKFKDRRKAIEHVMDTLFSAMLYTSLTSAAGFASLAITPIPPVQIFGIYVAIGIMIAWFFTMTFIPAYIMLLPERTLARFGSMISEEDDSGPDTSTRLGRLLAGAGVFTFRHARIVLVGAVLLGVVAAYGISKIQVNDNPTRWFKHSHPIRVADRVLNEHFGGTYMAYLALQPESTGPELGEYAVDLEARLRRTVDEMNLDEEPKNALLAIASLLHEKGAETQTIQELRQMLHKEADDRLNAASEALMTADPEDSVAESLVEAWEDLLLFLDMEEQRNEIFKQPEALAYLEKLQNKLLETNVVGKSNSLTDIVKTVYRELMEGNADYFTIPETARAVAQCLITFESSHRPQDLGHFVSHDFRETSLWVQLKSGNNQDMKYVTEVMDAFIAENPPPFGLKHHWFGLTYINVVWQEKMVIGMLNAFLGSFLIVLLMMTVLFRSGLWGLISMIPLTVTIALIYGVVGLMGKDYDMPVAVLSSLTLGLAVDFAIHFLSRSREYHDLKGNWEGAYPLVYGEPVRAITRNVIAVAIGFTPLLAAPLVPYNTVGFFMAGILACAGLSTLFFLPALIKVLEKLLFPQDKICRITCRCGTCVVTAVIATATVALNVQQFLDMTWTGLSLVSLVVVLASGTVCFFMSRRESCKTVSDEK